MITLTESAAVKVKELLDTEGEPELALRVAVRPGGCCGGFSYELFFDGELDSTDETRDYGGVKVVSDPASAQMLIGATLDYSESDQQAGFSISNPNTQGSGGGCGCGSGGGHGGHGHHH